MTASERKRIPDLDSRDAKSTTTMLFSFEEGDAKDSIIQRRAQRPRRDINLDKRTSDDLIAATSYFVFSVVWGASAGV